MTSASVAVTIAHWASRSRYLWLAMTLVFAYTFLLNVHERPDGLKIASFFTAAIVITSMASRVIRSTELRVGDVRLSAKAEAFVDELATTGVKIIAHRPDKRTVEEYDKKERQAREDHSLDHGEPLIFLEVMQGDASEFKDDALDVRAFTAGRHRILRCTSPAVPNAIAALLLNIRDRTGAHSRRLLRLDRGQPRGLRAALPVPGRGRHRARDPGGPPPGHQEPAGAAPHPRGLTMTRPDTPY